MSILHRKKDKIRAAQCPVCGKYMNKKMGYVTVSEGFEKGLAVKKEQLLTYWYCPECNEEKKA